MEDQSVPCLQTRRTFRHYNALRQQTEPLVRPPEKSQHRSAARWMIFNQAARNKARNGLAAEELLDFNAHMRADAGTSRLRPWHLTLIHPSPPPYLTYLTGARLLYVPTRSFGALFTHPQTLEPSSPAPSWLSHVEPSRPSRLESRLCRCLSSLGTEGLIALWHREVSCSHALLPLSITATWTLDVVCPR